MAEPKDPQKESSTLHAERKRRGLSRLGTYDKDKDKKKKVQKGSDTESHREKDNVTKPEPKGDQPQATVPAILIQPTEESKQDKPERERTSLNRSGKDEVVLPKSARKDDSQDKSSDDSKSTTASKTDTKREKRGFLKTMVGNAFSISERLESVLTDGSDSEGDLSSPHSVENSGTSRDTPREGRSTPGQSSPVKPQGLKARPAFKKPRSTSTERPKARELILSPEQMVEIKESFSVFDENGNGSLSAAEISHVLKAVEREPTEAELDSLMSTATRSRNGEITFQEYQELMRRQLLLEEEDYVRTVFQSFDTKGKGYIEASELMTILTMGDVLAPADVQEIIDLADKDRSGKIELKTLVKLMCS